MGNRLRSPWKRLRENLLSACAFIAKRPVEAVFGSAFIVSARCRHSAATQAAGPLSPRGQLTPAPYIHMTANISCHHYPRRNPSGYGIGWYVEGNYRACGDDGAVAYGDSA